MQTSVKSQWWCHAFGLAGMAIGGVGCTDAVLPSLDGCEYEGRALAFGERVQADDRCNTCVCLADGDLSCTELSCGESDAGKLQQCWFEGRAHPLGEAFPSADGQDKCHCEVDGRVVCLAPESPPVHDRCYTCQSEANGQVKCEDLPCADAAEGAGAAIVDEFAAAGPGAGAGYGAAPNKGELTPANAGTGSIPGKTIVLFGSVHNTIVVHNDGAHGPVGGAASVNDAGLPLAACSFKGVPFRAFEITSLGDPCDTPCVCQPDGSWKCDPLACAEQPGSAPPDPGPSGCEYFGQPYATGDSFPALDSCGKCSCQLGGKVSCSWEGCDTGGSCALGDRALRYASGSEVVCGDGCNSCTCQDGGWLSSGRSCAALPTIRPCDLPAPELPKDSSQLKTVVLYRDGDRVALDVQARGCAEPEAPLELCYEQDFGSAELARTVVHVLTPKLGACQDTWRDQRVFDLTPLRDFYRSKQQTEQGKVLLQFQGEQVVYDF